MLPDMRYLREIEPKCLFGFHNAKPLCKSLHHPILDPVVYHLDEMTCAMWTYIAPAFIWCWSQCLKDGTDLFHDLSLATDHQAVSFRQAPNSSARAAVYEVNAFWFKHFGMAD